MTVRSSTPAPWTSSSRSFAYIRGALTDLTTENTPLIRGLRRGQHTFDGIIRTADTAGFGPGVQIESPTIERVVVHHVRPRDEEP